MSRLARLGAFIVATLAVLAAGVFIIGSKEYLFRSTYQLKTQFDNVAGLAQGADVQVGGVHSGTVQSITLPHKPGDKVIVVMDLDRSTKEIVKRDSVASIETEGVLGNQFVAISFGSAGQAEVADGETIQSAPPLELGALLTKANAILDSSQQAIVNTTAAGLRLFFPCGSRGRILILPSPRPHAELRASPESDVKKASGRDIPHLCPFNSS